jgi:hypothetical protein
MLSEKAEPAPGALRGAMLGLNQGGEDGSIRRPGGAVQEGETPAQVETAVRAAKDRE